MDATITRLPVKTPAPRWDADNPTAKLIAEDLHRHGVTPGEAYGAVSLVPEYLPVAEALERLLTAEDVADVSRDMIRAASR